MPTNFEKNPSYLFDYPIIFEFAFFIYMEKGRVMSVFERPALGTTSEL